MTEDQLKKFIHQHTLAVIATFGEQYPESAVIEFGDVGLQLIFDADSASRKFQNIMRTPKASFVIGWQANKTVQYEGEASMLKGEESEHYKQLYFAKTPDAQKWEYEEDIAYFKVTPEWIRYTDLAVEPWLIEEFRF